ncbi:MAG: hypothetical protein LBQ74_15300 [Prevotella sp.]|jgi:hypothetical protein|nr:hypothetical protein [Prevotella sp.]
MDTIKTDYRQAGIDWLNSRDRDMDKGLSILKDAGYKPHVVENFEKHKGRVDIPKKLIKEMRNYVNYCTHPDPDAPDHEDELPVTDPDVFVPNIEQELSKEYPPVIKKILTECRELYTERSIQHTALKNVGEGNDDESTAKRKSIGLIMDAASRRMDTLWKAFEAYKLSGTEPDEEALFAEPFNPEAVVKKEALEPKDEKLVLPDDMEALKKMSENWRTKLAKAGNKLNYQSEKKDTKLNPMPQGPKRIAQEKRVAKLKEEKLAIDTKIAELK